MNLPDPICSKPCAKFLAPFQTGEIRNFHAGGHKQMQRYLKKRINEERGPLTRIRKVEIQGSRNNNLIQMADMVAGAIARSYRKEKSDSMLYRGVIKHRELSVQFWPK